MRQFSSGLFPCRSDQRSLRRQPSLERRALNSIHSATPVSLFHSKALANVRGGANDLIRRGMKLLGSQHEKMCGLWQLNCRKGLGGERQRRKHLRKRESLQRGL